jgi:hypothetical protein
MLWHKAILIAALSVAMLLASSCAMNPLVEKTTLIDRPAFITQEVPAAQQHDFVWVVITKDNFEAKMKELQGGIVVLFAVTPEGYQNIILNEAELRRYIQQQNAVIAGYKAYYEESKPQQETDSKPFWKFW